MNEFRELRANEIDVRIQSINKGQKGVGAILLLYKDARCDMNILDESVGILGWKREHKMIGDRLYCVVSLYDEEKKEWISKEDVGTESNTEAEKGHASDSFKRACFNWGIGRELYTAPFTYVQLNEGEYYDDKGRTKSNAKFYVKEIEYADRKISKLVLVDSKGTVRFTYPKVAIKKEFVKQIDEPEVEPVQAQAQAQQKVILATDKQVQLISTMYTKAEINKMLKNLGVKTLKEITVAQASTMISARKDKNDGTTSESN